MIRWACKVSKQQKILNRISTYLVWFIAQFSETRNFSSKIVSIRSHVPISGDTNVLREIRLIVASELHRFVIVCCEC